MKEPFSQGNQKLSFRFSREKGPLSNPYSVFLSVLSVDHIAHLIPSGALARQELGGLNGALSEDRFGVGGVLECHHLIGSREDHIVLAHNCAAPHR